VFPTVEPGPTGPPLAREWLFTTRAGAEMDLIEELTFLDAEAGPRRAGEALVAARRVPRAEGRPAELAFARQGFPVSELVAQPEAELARALVASLPGAPAPWALDVWVPDTDEANRLAGHAAALEAAVIAALPSLAPGWAATRLPDARAALGENGLYAQACLLPSRACAVGVLPARDAPSLAPGGRLRVRVPSTAPSRAAMKLLEAFAWLDRAPDPGDLCVDLGAAPGGWTWALLERRARVIAVDPGNLDGAIARRKGLIHARGDAFRFAPPVDEPVDWLFCDMAFRPLEVAGLLAKWARRQWARLLVANLKLPMRKKAEHLFRVRDILTDGGWASLRARQLYHDRDEVTIAAVRLT
jgi:23S rRNA (cytidine2498-2'-O)-methyltransferase